MINIMLVDDHQLFVDGLKTMLASVHGMKVIAEASDGETCLSLLRECRPDIILMDIKMPGIGGLETLRKILRSAPDMKVVIVTMFQDEPFPSRFLESGASGYISKDQPFEELTKAIRAVHAGQRFITPEIAQKLALRNIGPATTSPFESLSERETQIMMMIINKYSIAEISSKLCLSSKTVNTYRYRLFSKLGINSDVQLTHLAIRHGVLEIEQA